MLVDALRRNNFFALSFCFVLLLLLWLPRLLAVGSEVPAPGVYQAMANQSLWLAAVPPTGIWTVVAFLLTFAAAATFTLLNNRHLFHTPNEFLLPLVYILLSSAIPGTQWFSGVQVATLFIFTGLNYLLISYKNKPGLGALFIAVFCFSLASLCFPPALLLLLLLIPAAVLILRSFSWRDAVVTFMAAITPFAYLLFFYWLTTHDATVAYNALLMLLPQIPNNTMSANWPVLVFFVCLALLTLIALTRTLAKQSVTKVRIAHIRTVFILMLVFGIAGLVFYPAYNYQIMPLLAAPAAVVIAAYLAQPGKRKRKVACWLLLAGAIIYLQMAEFL